MQNKLAWTDIHQIAQSLSDQYPEVDPLSVRFTDLRKWILMLPHFSDDPNRSNEAILEAIQMAWLEERA